MADYYDLTVQARLKSDGSWVNLAKFPWYRKTGRKIQRGFWVFKWKEDEYEEYKERLEMALVKARTAMLAPEYQDVEIEEFIPHMDGYRYIWRNGVWI